MSIQRQQIRTHNMKTFLDRVVELAQQGYTLDPSTFPRRTFGNQFMASMVKADGASDSESESIKSEEEVDSKPNDVNTETDLEKVDSKGVEETPKVTVSKQAPKTAVKTAKVSGDK